ncbi:pyridoxamine kinase [Anaerostipes sp.]|uniref:pyridoxamine kinase n=1 Tax=Anaerostipes sp. TaxID=1872530 RepID=UPI0025C60A5C|nr:pyridoxamine kinase [Anaerostipes sp.]MBS7009700.1 pyridoxamine kinase [Anaerostipes sp.]
MKDQILLINDMAGYGKVALSAMLPVMTHAGLNLYSLPTALVSNTLDYGRFEILETTDYMRQTLNVWEELNFSFDAVCTGFIVSEEQGKLICGYLREQKKRGTWIFADPIMGDEGKLYNGIDSRTIGYMRDLCSLADVIVPNLTEAAFLADIYQEKEVVSDQEAEELLKRLRMLGAKSVVITSVKTKHGDFVFVYDDKTETVSKIPFECVPVRFPGTGDIFSAILVSQVLNQIPLEKAVKRAMSAVRQLILLNKDTADKFKGIPIEKNLEVLNFESSQD